MARLNSAIGMQTSGPSKQETSGSPSSVGNIRPDGLSGEERRAWQRFILEAPASISLQVPGHDVFNEIELVDVSLGGFRLRFEGDVPTGSEVEIDHPVAGSMRGELAWQSGGDIGIRMLDDDNRRMYLLRLISMILHSESHSAAR